MTSTIDTEPLEYDVQALLTKLAENLQQYLKERDLEDPLLMGIHTGGVWLADYLAKSLSINAPIGTLDISFYRDDFTHIGLHPEVRPSSIPFEIENRNIILVDDVVYTGRTIRAALNEIFDYGRPNAIVLAALVERAGRELPIRCDVVAETIAVNRDQNIKLLGPEPMTLVKMKRGTQSDAKRCSV